MTDIVDKHTRSRMMAGIRGKDTQPELVLRRALHRAGFRFRLHGLKLPGKPDLVFARYRAVVFVHGCFWHLHDCHLFKWPATREQFWRDKIEKNAARDKGQIAALQQQGWRVAVVWECALKGKARYPVSDVVDALSMWIKSDERVLEIRGDEARTAR